MEVVATVETAEVVVDTGVVAMEVMAVNMVEEATEAAANSVDEHIGTEQCSHRLFGSVV